VQPNGTEQGKLPIVDQHRRLPNVWLFTGLGSRGLIYHALCAEVVAAAAAANDKHHIPVELRRAECGLDTPWGRLLGGGGLPPDVVYSTADYFQAAKPQYGKKKRNDKRPSSIEGAETRDRGTSNGKRR
jgi:hypothetical protein